MQSTATSSMQINNPSLVAAFIVTSYLTRLCNRRPNPPPQRSSTANGNNGKDHPSRQEQQQPADFLLLAPHVPQLREYILLLLQAGHIILTARTQSFPRPPSRLAPDTSALDAKYFSWSTHTTTWLAVLLAACSLRLAAFASLKQDFTFELHPPRKLITTGLYAHVQHPSYPGDVLVTLANIALFAQPMGWVGTWLPASLRERLVAHKAGLGVAMGVIVFGAFATRVKQEEDMLRREFGDEWERWHARTARFIPGVF